MNKMYASGFTLIELMVTVVILAIIMTAAAPSLRDMILNNRMATQANDFLGAMNLARSEAVKRGQKVALCKSTNLTACATSGGWDQGWIMFVDENDDAVLDAGETVLKVHESIAPSTLTGNSNVDTYLSYASTGVTQLKNGGGFQSGTLKLCPAASGLAGKGRKIMISASGRARIVLDTDTSTTADTCA